MDIRLIFLNKWPLGFVVIFCVFITLFLAKAYKGLNSAVRERTALCLFGLRFFSAMVLASLIFMPKIEIARPVKNSEITVFIIDNSRSMGIKDHSRPRIDIAKSLIRSYIAKHKNDDIFIYDLFGRRIYPFLLRFTRPGGEFTDITAAIEKVRHKLKDRRIKEAFLISDGCNLSEEEIQTSLYGTPFPINSVLLSEGAREPAKDIGIADIVVNKTARIEEALEAEFIIRNYGYDSVSIPLEIKYGKDVLASANVYLTGEERIKKVKLKIAPHSYGDLVYTAALDVKEASKISHDNTKNFTVTVRKEPIRVLYVDGFLRWEHKFLKRALEKDKEVELNSVLRTTRASGEKKEARGELFTKDALSNNTIVILGDIEAGYFTNRELDNLVGFIADGGSLVLLGGYSSFGKDGFRATALANALPVVFSDEEDIQVNKPFRLKLTEEGQNSTIFDITGDKTKNSLVWKAAPELDGYIKTARPKIGATALAVHPQDAQDSYNRPIVILQRYGQGRVVVILTDTLWKWSTIMQGLGYGDTLYSKFWAQTLRYMAPPGRTTAGEKERMVISSDKDIYDEGDRAKVTASFIPDDKRASQMAAYIVKGVLLNDSGDKDEVIFKAKRDFYEAKIKLVKAGRYVLSVLAEDKYKRNSGPIQTYPLLVKGEALEMSGFKINEKFLSDLSSATGGGLVDMADFLELKEEASEPPVKRPLERIAFSVWDSPFTFILFIGLLSLDWYIRKRSSIF